MVDIDLSDIDVDLSEEELEVLMSVLSEVSESGDSSTLNNLWESDYEELPVDIRTFILDKDYLGETFVDEDGNVLMYEYWIKYLESVFYEGSGIMECAFSGAIG